MFFLITHILIGKYYPSLFTQFIIGCTFYVLSILIIKDIFSGNCYEEYKYQALFLVAIDASFLLYKAKTTIHSKKTNKSPQFTEKETSIEQLSTDLKSGSIQSVTLSSEINDFKITHSISLESEEKNSMFSTSDGKSDNMDIQTVSNDSSNKIVDVSIDSGNTVTKKS